MATITPTVEEQREALLAKHQGLDKALECQHNIVQDIAARFASTGRLSDKQIALVFKIAKQDAERRQREADRAVEDLRIRESGVSITEGRQTIFGTVLQVTLRDTDFGPVLKMIVQSPVGLKYWGTVPSALVGALSKGDRVEFTATVAKGDDPIFGFFKRPSNAAIIH